MPIGTNNGKTIYASARDIGNMMAGYKAGSSGLKWSDVETVFDMYESRSIFISEHEGISTRNAEKFGYMIGHGTLPNGGRDRALNLLTLFLSLFDY